MPRPLLITDCDEVLLHMVSHFETWLDEVHEIDFSTGDGDALVYSMTDRRSGKEIAPERVWDLLDGFFAGEMHRQTIAAGAAEALGRIAEVADIVVLTNIVDLHHAGRVRQLEAHGIRHRVICNQGGKGKPVRRLIEEFAPSAAVFVDDLSTHHASVAERAPDVARLHMIIEPRLAPRIPPAPHAHARIDDWATAEPWIRERLGVA